MNWRIYFGISLLIIGYYFQTRGIPAPLVPIVYHPLFQLFLLVGLVVMAVQVFQWVGNSHIEKK